MHDYFSFGKFQCLMGVHHAIGLSHSTLDVVFIVDIVAPERVKRFVSDNCLRSQKTAIKILQCNIFKSKIVTSTSI